MTAPTPDDRKDFRLHLQGGDDSRTVVLRVPTQPVHTADLLPVIQRLDDAVVEVAVENAHRAGRHVSCAVGCAACCRQLIPISRAEAWHIAELVARLPEPKRTTVRGRFHAAAVALDAAGMTPELWNAHTCQNESVRAQLGYRYFDLQLPCPFLADERCSVYDDRPLVCREYLVHSPPERCWNPSAEHVEPVAVSTKVSDALYRFGDDGQPQSARWFPLVFALRWAEQQTGPPPMIDRGPEVFRRFLSQIASS